MTDRDTSHGIVTAASRVIDFDPEAPSIRVDLLTSHVECQISGRLSGCEYSHVPSEGGADWSQRSLDTQGSDRRAPVSGTQGEPVGEFDPCFATLAWSPVPAAVRLFVVTPWPAMRHAGGPGCGFYSATLLCILVSLTGNPARLDLCAEAGCAEIAGPDLADDADPSLVVADADPMAGSHCGCPCIPTPPRKPDARRPA